MLLIDIHDVPTGHPVVCGANCIACSLSQLMDVQVTSLNPDLPDFYFVNVEGKGIGISRKQVGEMLSGLDRVEEQLRRDYEHVDHLYLLVAGIIIPSGANECQVAERSGSWFRLHGRNHADGDYHFNYLGYRKKLASFRRWGVTVIETPTHETLVTDIQALYENEMTPFEDITTFRKALRTKFTLPPDASPFVKTLMGVADKKTGRTFIGEETAKAIEVAGLRSLHEVTKGLSGDLMFNMDEVRLASGRRLGKAMTERMREALL